MSNLALQLVKDPRFEWKPGMLGYLPEPYAIVPECLHRVGDPFNGKGDPCFGDKWEPVLTDPATQGCLWAMLIDCLEERFGQVGVTAECWVVLHGKRDSAESVLFSGPYGDNLAAALLEVWGS